jgi:pimeloyl-ACP methyl ester carboxylesterase
MTEIDGLDVHFIHVRSQHDDALPIIVNHGWPGSISEQLKIIDRLTDPTTHGAIASDAFHVVIPSMPGYGFSSKPTSTGWSPERMGRAWAELMTRLGYTRHVDYARYMASRPQTLCSIADSPVGVAAWLLDHNDANGQPAAAVVAALDRTASATGELTRDEILDNITLYWLTKTGVSASRLHWEYKGGFFDAKGVSVPVAVSVFPGEQYQAPRS